MNMNKARSNSILFELGSSLASLGLFRLGWAHIRSQMIWKYFVYYASKIAWKVQLSVHMVKGRDLRKQVVEAQENTKTYSSILYTLDCKLVT